MSTHPQMKYTKLGSTGLKVSRLCLGCMSFGSSKWQPWVMDEKEGKRIVKRAWDLGINFFDTADVYSNGESERVLGLALKEHNIPRDNVVIATKCYFPVSDDVSFNTLAQGQTDKRFLNGRGLSRKHIFNAVKNSLKRLGVDYIDLYQIHRWDYETPIEETMKALNDLVELGLVRYIGASSMYTWQFHKANAIAERNGWVKFISMQNFYNLLYREEEREMIPYCLDEKISCIPWSPLARGRLARKNQSTTRSESDHAHKQAFESDVDSPIIERVIEIAEKKSISPARVALAWVLTKDVVAAPIIGAGKVENLEDLVGALDVELTAEEVTYLEELYKPKAIAGHT
ncbi:Aldo/keto reductase [Basidiobolus meristosporus CBS 931.73]|uniref:Aldo/keto reductase n=1 Tax=Basidiobolus meristosporus CBS 931.73 TaxID=1314790 RepID=A0A1Y1XLT5_9FUNG|nr:Aldo/keto reductase [Basidiobolus meristosporus CBS 931.73]|eukprot:ORX86709.1 Aldo/keto reductase [Basidiobolus meristosporus CBS 931.73]